MSSAKNGLGKASANRFCFEPDTVFEQKGDICGVILEAYERASVNAERTARRAVQSGSSDSMRLAIWDEAVAQTLEAVLGGFFRRSESTDTTGQDEEIEMPDSPEPQQ